MIDRLRSMGRVELPRSLGGFLSRYSEEEESVDSPSDGTVSRDPVRTPEERVLALLDDNGGRMWQQSIVSETGYSEAKVSRLLSGLEADEIIDRHWRGGQKVVVLDWDSVETIQSDLGSPSLVRR